MPATPGPFPVVIVVQEIFGVHEHIRDVCRRLARAGYLAIAPEMYVRQGSVADMTDVKEIIAKVVSKVPDAQVMSDLDATVAYAKNTGKGDTAKLGITGFCWGGSVVWMAAALVPEVRAGVAWYGRLVAPQTSQEQRPWPYDIAATIHAPVLGLYGENDQGIPVSTVEQMRAALNAADNPTGSTIIVYPGVGHGFHADYRESYNAEVAADGWRRCLAWFRDHGVA
jgi:carboxymethylenebutenolidase